MLLKNFSVNVFLFLYFRGVSVSAASNRSKCVFCFHCINVSSNSIYPFLTSMSTITGSPTWEFLRKRFWT